MTQTFTLPHVSYKGFVLDPQNVNWNLRMWIYLEMSLKLSLGKSD